MFSLINLKAENIAPLALIAAAAIGGWYLFTRARANQAAAANATQTSPATPTVGNLTTLAMLQALFGGNANPQPVTATTGSNAGVAPLAVIGASTVGAGSSTGNTVVTQGV